MMLIAEPYILEDQIASGWLVEQPKPWLIEITEPLTSKVPNPNLAIAYCCYINTVIFYVRPYQVRTWHHFWRCGASLRAEKPGSTFDEWGRVDSALRWDQIVTWKGEEFECGGGQVFWAHKRWWMKRWARRRKNDN
ncbi:hypothetical protein Acid345_3376 [Candidatus Koribacter versatilis Ellin345]|uniref:Uncharacterized protein n=1 Tax=Koribacter versatilis (strain Ellin345) TaxID=204669 RepID=Q1IL73_KORVE|nr:hypothetical protein [Candidatus Koribacter versatilis]ABF42377.1 hypothetical protein Acid345_3376 [Candidatus Koribacter versatilis Ellin345]